MKKVLLIVPFCLGLVLLQSCLIFKTYNSQARYKDNAREIVLSTDTTFIIGTGAKNDTVYVH